MKWININDKLPKKYQTVLASDTNSDIHLVKFRGAHGNPEYYWDGDTYGLSKDHITHWMPLPKPPIQKLGKSPD